MERTGILNKINDLPDHAVVDVQEQTGCGWQASIALCDDYGRPGRGYIGDPHVQVGHWEKAAALKIAAGRVRDLARCGHISAYELRYRLLPFWEKRASSSGLEVAAVFPS